MDPINSHNNCSKSLSEPCACDFEKTKKHNEVLKEIETFKRNLSALPVDQVSVGRVRPYPKIELNKDNSSLENSSDVNVFIPFHVINITNSGMYSKELEGIRVRFNGLCEILCNKILLDDLLGHEDPSVLSRELNAGSLNEEFLLNSHILDLYSTVWLIISYLIGVYPDNILSITEQWNFVKENKLNEEIFFTCLDKIEYGKTLKLEIFEKSKNGFSGHSTLIKKISDNEFIFFDPSHGEYRRLTKSDLLVKVNKLLNSSNTKDVLVIDGEVYMERLIRKITTDKVNGVAVPKVA